MAIPTTNYGFLKPQSGETYDVATLDTDLDNIDAAIHAPGIKSVNPMGLMAMDERTTNSTVNSSINVIQSIASFTFKANRWYLVEWVTTLQPSVANQQGLMQIQTCATTDPSSQTTGLTEIRGVNVNAPGTYPIPGYAARKIKYGVDTTLQIKATVTGGTGTLGTLSGPTFPGQLSITDVGAQY